LVVMQHRGLDLKLFQEHSAPWTSEILEWLTSFVDSRVRKAASEQSDMPTIQRDFFTVKELGQILPGAPIHSDTIRRCIRKHRLQPHGIGFRKAKLYRIKQFEEAFEREAKSSEVSLASTSESNSPFTRVVARRNKSRKAS